MQTLVIDVCVTETMTTFLVLGRWRYIPLPGELIYECIPLIVCHHM